MLNFHVALLSFPSLMFVCVCVFICCDMALIQICPVMLEGTYHF